MVSSVFTASVQRVLSDTVSILAYLGLLPAVGCGTRAKIVVWIGLDQGVANIHHSAVDPWCSRQKIS
jgi:hypothetical protein